MQLQVLRSYMTVLSESEAQERLSVDDLHRLRLWCGRLREGLKVYEDDVYQRFLDADNHEEFFEQELHYVLVLEYGQLATTSQTFRMTGICLRPTLDMAENPFRNLYERLASNGGEEGAFVFPLSFDFKLNARDQYLAKTEATTGGRHLEITDPHLTDDVMLRVICLAFGLDLPKDTASWLAEDYLEWILKELNLMGHFFDREILAEMLRGGTFINGFPSIPRCNGSLIPWRGNMPSPDVEHTEDLFTWKSSKDYPLPDIMNGTLAYGVAYLRRAFLGDLKYEVPETTKASVRALKSHFKKTLPIKQFLPYTSEDKWFALHDMEEELKAPFWVCVSTRGFQDFLMKCFAKKESI